MFKVGDRVRCLKSFMQPGPKKGNVYNIVNINKAVDSAHAHFGITHWLGFKEIDNGRANWGDTEFKIDNPPANEVEWLDRIKDNFKE